MGSCHGVYAQKSKTIEGIDFLLFTVWIHGIKLRSLGLAVIASTSEPSFWPKFLYSWSDWGLLFRKGVGSFG